jgi:plasmid stability protein
MTDPVRLILDTDDVIDRALRLRAAKEGLSPSAVISEILRKALVAEIDEVSGQPSVADVIQGVIDANQKTTRS